MSEDNVVSTTDRLSRSASIGAPGGAPEAEQPYNYERFQPQTLVKDAGLTLRSKGPTAGDVAPDFELRDTTGRSWQLSALRGHPVVLILGSGT